MTDPALRARFLEAMSRIPATVTIVTTDGPHGRYGITVSAMSAVSADGAKPTILVCINQSSRAVTPLLNNGTFAVNVLQSSQADLASVFAGRTLDPSLDRFGVGAWSMTAGGSPVLQDALATFECQICDSHLVGTHHVIFGTVGGIGLAAKGKTLVYADRAFAVSVPLPTPACHTSG